jgi:hypothetical protein
MIFAQNFDGFEVVIGKLLMMVTEKSMQDPANCQLGEKGGGKKSTWSWNS